MICPILYGAFNFRHTNNGGIMKRYLKLWFVILTIVLLWIYFIFLSPRIFRQQILVVPDVIHLPASEAEKRLKEEHIQYQITYIESTQEEALKTIPFAGTSIKSNYVIDLYVGMRMPKAYHSYLGQNYENVKEEIEKMCLEHHIKLEIDYEKSNQMSGIIIKESLTDGSILNDQTELKLTLAYNEETFLMPNLIGMNIEDALALMHEYQFSVHINYYISPIEEDIVLFQSTAPSTLVRKQNKSILELYVSKGMLQNTTINVDECIEIMYMLDYDVELHYVDSNEIENKLVAFKCQKLYDINRVKYILWITK